MKARWLLAALVLHAPSMALAQPSEPSRKYKPLRNDENWAWLRSPSPSRDPWDSLKYVELSRRDAMYLSLGGEVRQWLEGYSNEGWGAGKTRADAYWLQRYMLHLDAHLTPFVRVFAQLKSGIEVGRVGGPRPVDQDLLDFNQLFADAAFVPGATIDDVPKVLLRIGRQEMSYGSGRFIEVREGPNVRFGYDGARLMTRQGPLRLDAFLVRPQRTEPNVFDDIANSSQVFWGTYGTLDLPALTTDLFYLGADRQSVAYVRGAGDERRHTIGARARAKLVVTDLEIEGAYQFGQIAAMPISAWTLAGQSVVRMPHLPLKPVTTLSFGVTSGDRGPTSSALGTFSALFPRGSYFGLVGANGPGNNVSPHASVALTIFPDVLLTLEVWSFWRQTLWDGMYSVSGRLIRPGNPTDARYVGTQLEGFLNWQVDRHLSVNGTLAYCWAGAFFDTAAPGKDITYGAVWGTYKF